MADARKQTGDSAEAEIPIKVNRVGDARGKHVCRIDVGQYETSIGFTVDGLGSYAKGALAAGHWLDGRPNGLYVPANMLEAN